MANETSITIIGNLVADPEARTIGNGSTVANFTIASTPRTFNRDTNQWEDGQPLFMRCSAWRDLAKHVADSLAKGMRVIASGTISQRQYKANDGTNRTVVEMTVDEIGPSLMYATAQVVKQQRGQQGNGQWQQTQQDTRNHAPASRPAKDDPWGAPQQSGFNGDGFGGGSNDEPEF